MSTMPAALYDSLDHYLNELFTLRNDTSVAVRTLVCAGLVQFLNMTPERLQTHLRELVQYMLHATQDAEPEVALEACEFWSAFCESQLATHYSQVLQEFLPSLIPILLRNMSYADDDEDALLAEAEESSAGVEDREQDLKPFHAQGRAEHGGTAEEEDDDDEVNQWNLRKCSAAGLDNLSTVYNEKLLPIMLPIVEQRLSDADWKVRVLTHTHTHAYTLVPFRSARWTTTPRVGGSGRRCTHWYALVGSGRVCLAEQHAAQRWSRVMHIHSLGLGVGGAQVRESAILALGAVAEGCAQGLVALLPQLVKFLVPLLDDPRPLVRSITCWSLSRFSQWLLESAATAGAPSPRISPAG